jgi:hypothetical protein
MENHGEQGFVARDWRQRFWERGNPIFHKSFNKSGTVCLTCLSLFLLGDYQQVEGTGGD